MPPGRRPAAAHGMAGRARPARGWSPDPAGGDPPPTPTPSAVPPQRPDGRWPRACRASASIADSATSATSLRATKTPRSSGRKVRAQMATDRRPRPGLLQARRARSCGVHLRRPPGGQRADAPLVAQSARGRPACAGGVRHRVILCEPQCPVSPARRRGSGDSRRAPSRPRRARLAHASERVQPPARRHRCPEARDSRVRARLAGPAASGPVDRARIGWARRRSGPDDGAPPASVRGSARDYHGAMYSDALSFLEDERDTFRPYEALDALSDEQLDAPVEAAGGWSGRDLMGHIVTWQEAALATAKELAMGERSATMERVEAEWNASPEAGDAINQEALRGSARCRSTRSGRCSRRPWRRAPRVPHGGPGVALDQARGAPGVVLRRDHGALRGAREGAAGDPGGGSGA